MTRHSTLSFWPIFNTVQENRVVIHTCYIYSVGWCTYVPYLPEHTAYQLNPTATYNESTLMHTTIYVQSLSSIMWGSRMLPTTYPVCLCHYIAKDHGWHQVDFHHLGMPSSFFYGLIIPFVHACNLKEQIFLIMSCWDIHIATYGTNACTFMGKLRSGNTWQRKKWCIFPGLDIAIHVVTKVTNMVL